MHHKEFCVPGSRIVHFVWWELSCEVGLCISFGGSIIAAPRRQFRVRFWNSMRYSQQKTEWDKLRFSDEAALITPSQFLCRAVCITPSTAIFCWCCFGLVPHQNSLRDWALLAVRRRQSYVVHLSAGVVRFNFQRRRFKEYRCLAARGYSFFERLLFLQ